MVTCLRRIYSRSAFVRMCLTLESRGFGLMGRGEGPVWVPWFDFANHPAEGVGRAGRAVQLDMQAISSGQARGRRVAPPQQPPLS